MIKHVAADAVFSVVFFFLLLLWGANVIVAAGTAVLWLAIGIAREQFLMWRKRRLQAQRRYLGEPPSSPLA